MIKKTKTSIRADLGSTIACKSRTWKRKAIPVVLLACFTLPVCFDYITFFKDIADSAMERNTTTFGNTIAQSPILDTNINYTGRWYASAEDGLTTRFTVRNTGNAAKAVMIVDFIETRTVLDTIDIKLDLLRNGTFVPVAGGIGLINDSIILLENLGAVNQFDIEVTASGGAPLGSILKGISVTPAVLYKATKSITTDYLATRIPIKTGPWGYLLFKPVTANIEQVVENLRVKVTVGSEVLELQPFADETGGTPCKTRMVDSRGWWSWQFPAGWSYKINEIQVKLGNKAQYGTSISTTIVAVTDGDADSDGLPTYLEVINNIEGITPAGATGLDPVEKEKSWYTFERFGPDMTPITDLALGAGELWGSIIAWFNGDGTTEATLSCSNDCFAHNTDGQDEIYIMNVNEDFTYDEQERLSYINNVIDLTPNGELLDGMYQIQYKMTGKYSSLRLVTGAVSIGSTGQVFPYAPLVLNGQEDTDGDNAVDMIETNVGTFDRYDRDSDDDGLIDGLDAIPNDKESYNTGKMDVQFNSGGSTQTSCHLDSFLGSHRAHLEDDDTTRTPSVSVPFPAGGDGDFAFSAELIITDQYKTIPFYMMIYDQGGNPAPNIQLFFGGSEGSVGYNGGSSSYYLTTQGAWKYNVPFSIQIQGNYYSAGAYTVTIDGRVIGSGSLVWSWVGLIVKLEFTPYTSIFCDIYLDNIDISWTSGIDATFETQQVVRAQVDYPGNKWMVSATQSILTNIAFKASHPDGQSMMGRFTNTDATPQNSIYLDYLFSMPTPITPSASFPVSIEYDLFIQPGSQFNLLIGDKNGRDWIKTSFLSSYLTYSNVLLFQDDATAIPFNYAWTANSLNHVKIRIVDGNRWFFSLNGIEYGTTGGYRTKSSHLMNIIRTFTISSIETKSCDLFIDNIKASWIEGIDERFDYTIGENILAKSPDYVQYKIDVHLEDVSLFSEEWRPWGNNLFSIIPAIRMFGNTVENNTLRFSSGYAVDTLVHGYKLSEDLLIPSTSIDETWFDSIQDPLESEDGTFRDYSITPLKPSNQSNLNNYAFTFEFSDRDSWDDDDGDLRPEKFLRFDVVYAVYMLEPGRASRLVQVYDYESAFTIQSASIITASRFAYAVVNANNFKQQYGYASYMLKYLGFVKNVKGDAILDTMNNPISNFTDSAVKYIPYMNSIDAISACLKAGSTLVGVINWKSITPNFNKARTISTVLWHALESAEQVTVSVSNRSGTRYVYNDLSSINWIDTKISLYHTNALYQSALDAEIQPMNIAAIGIQTTMALIVSTSGVIKKYLTCTYGVDYGEPGYPSFGSWLSESETFNTVLVTIDVFRLLYTWLSFAESCSTEYHGQFSYEMLQDIMSGISLTASAAIHCLVLLKSSGHLAQYSVEGIKLLGKGISAVIGCVVSIISLLQDIDELSKAYETGDSGYIQFATFKVVMSVVSVIISAVAVVAIVGAALGWTCAAALASTCNIVGLIAAGFVVIGTLIFMAIEQQKAEEQRQEQLRQLRQQINQAFWSISHVSVEKQKNVHGGVSNYWSVGFKARDGLGKETMTLFYDIKLEDALSSLPNDMTGDKVITSGVYWECIREVLPYYGDPNEPASPVKLFAPLYNSRPYSDGSIRYISEPHSLRSSLTYTITISIATPELSILDKTWFAGRILRDRNVIIYNPFPIIQDAYRGVTGEIPDQTNTKFSVTYSEDFLNLGPVFPTTIFLLTQKLQQTLEASNLYAGTFDLKAFRGYSPRSVSDVRLYGSTFADFKGHNTCVKVSKTLLIYNSMRLPPANSFYVSLNNNYDFGKVYHRDGTSYTYHMAIPALNMPTPQTSVTSKGHVNGFVEFWLYIPNGNTCEFNVYNDEGACPNYIGFYSSTYPAAIITNLPYQPFYQKIADWTFDAWHHVKIRYKSSNYQVIGDFYVDNAYVGSGIIAPGEGVQRIGFRTDLSNGVAYVDAFACSWDPFYTEGQNLLPLLTDPWARGARIGQVFQATTSTIYGIRLQTRADPDLPASAIPTELVVQLSSAGVASPGLPGTSPLTNFRTNAFIGVEGDNYWVSLMFPTPVTVTPGQYYAFTLDTCSANVLSVMSARSTSLGSGFEYMAGYMVSSSTLYPAAATWARQQRDLTFEIILLPTSISPSIIANTMEDSWQTSDVSKNVISSNSGSTIALQNVYGFAQVFTATGITIESVKVRALRSTSNVPNYVNIWVKPYNPDNLNLNSGGMNYQTYTYASTWGMTDQTTSWRQFDFKCSGLISGQKYILVMNADPASTYLGAYVSNNKQQDYLGGTLYVRTSSSDAFNFGKYINDGVECDLNFQIVMNDDIYHDYAFPASTASSYKIDAYGLAQTFTATQPSIRSIKLKTCNSDANSRTIYDVKFSIYKYEQLVMSSTEQGSLSGQPLFYKYISYQDSWANAFNTWKSISFSCQDLAVGSQYILAMEASCAVDWLAAVSTDQGICDYPGGFCLRKIYNPNGPSYWEIPRNTVNKYGVDLCFQIEFGTVVRYSDYDHNDYVSFAENDVMCGQTFTATGTNLDQLQLKSRYIYGTSPDKPVEISLVAYDDNTGIPRFRDVLVTRSMRYRDFVGGVSYDYVWNTINGFSFAGLVPGKTYAFLIKNVGNGIHKISSIDWNYRGGSALKYYSSNDSWVATPGVDIVFNMDMSNHVGDGLGQSFLLPSTGLYTSIDSIEVKVADITAGPRPETVQVSLREINIDGQPALTTLHKVVVDYDSTWLSKTDPEWVKIPFKVSGLLLGRTYAITFEPDRGILQMKKSNRLGTGDYYSGMLFFKHNGIWSMDLDNDLAFKLNLNNKAFHYGDQGKPVHLGKAIVTGSEDIAFYFGSTGNTISWRIEDITYANPTYQILRNGSLFDGPKSWAFGTEVNLNLDTLPLGKHNFTIIVDDKIEGIVKDTIFVTVTMNLPPAISIPFTTYIYDVGTTGNNLPWYLTDFTIGSATYKVYKDHVQQGGPVPWISGTNVSYNIDGFSMGGSYNYTIIAEDGLGLRTQSTMIVTVDRPTIKAWSRYIGGWTNYSVTDLKTDSNNLYQASSFDGNTSRLEKLNSTDGTTLMTRNYKLSAALSRYNPRIAPTPGNIYLGYNAKPYSSSPETSIFAVLNSQGTVISQYTNNIYAGVGSKAIGALCTDKNGVYLLSCAGTVYKYSLSGQFLFAFEIAGMLPPWQMNDDYGTDIVVNPAENAVYVTGFKNDGTAGGYDVVIQKYSTGGKHLWSKIWGGLNDDKGAKLVIDGNALYVTGTTRSFGSTIKVFILRYNLNGDLLWNKMVDTGLTSAIKSDQSIAAKDGRIFLCAQVDSFSFVAKYNIMGKQQWIQYNMPGKHVTAGKEVGTFYISGYNGLDWYLEKYSFNDKPVIAHLQDRTIEWNSIGNVLSWSVTDVGNVAPSYNIYRNSTLVGSGIWIPGTKINYSIDGLSLDSDFNYTITYNDGLGENTQDQLVAKVRNLPPRVDSPPDQIYHYCTTEKYINWTITDPSINVATFTVYKDGAVNQTGTWTSGTVISTNITSLFIGTYNFTIEIRDGFGSPVKDMVFLTVLNNEPNVTRPPDQFFFFATTGHAINWTITDDTIAATNYTVTRDGNPVANGTWINGTVININVDGFFVGIYSFTIELHDGHGGSAQDTVHVNVLNSGLDIIGPESFSYEFQTTGHMLSWFVMDATISVTAFTILRNSAIIRTGSWTSDIGIVENIDGLSIGMYEFTFIAEDGLGTAMKHRVNVTVVNMQPCINSPADLIFIHNTLAHVIPWNITDFSTGGTSYTVYRNGTSSALSSWISSSLINVNVDDLPLGIHNITIVASDGLGGTLQDIVIVTVLNAVPTISNLTDIVYNHATSSQVLNWTVIDASINASETIYFIIKDGIQIANGTWINGTTISWDVSGLDIRIHDYIVVVFDGLGAYAIDDVLVTVLNNNPSLSVSSEPDFESGCKEMQFLFEIFDPDVFLPVYELFCNETSIVNNTWSSGCYVNANVLRLKPGTYNYSIFVQDGLGGTVNASKLVHVLPVPLNISPVISSATDFSFEQGTTGHVVNWTILDNTTHDPIYSFLVDGTVLFSGSWTTGVNLSINIDSVPVGNHTCQLIANDGYNEYAIDELLVNVTNVAPVIDSPLDFQFYHATSGNIISWNVSDASILLPSYTIYENGTIVANGTWTSGTPTEILLDGMPVGLYNYTIVLDDGFNGTAIDEVLVTVLNDAPVVSGSTDGLTFLLGNTGNVITWLVNDTSVSNTTFEIFINSTSTLNGTWWSNIPICFNVDSFLPGSSNISLHVLDGLGGFTMFDLNLSIINPAPFIIGSPDLIFKRDSSGHVISWTIWDATISSPNYFIFQNGTEINNGTWHSGSVISLNVDGIAIGIHNFTIIAADGAGGTSTYTIMVDVYQRVIINSGNITLEFNENHYYPNTTITWWIYDRMFQSGNNVWFSFDQDGTSGSFAYLPE
nr:hypothetical protein [Candidatus Sigynarchaeota archaeon]